jgi:hypothetical protein
MRIKANLVYFEGPFLKYFRKGERKESGVFLCGVQGRKS